MAENKMARNLMQQEPGRVSNGNAADAQNLTRPNEKRNNGTRYRVQTGSGCAFSVTAKGRARWALDRLREAGPAGCTPIHEPAPRWSAYVHVLRGLGIDIETVREAHGGAFPGHHARYVLRCIVTPYGVKGAQ